MQKRGTDHPPRRGSRLCWTVFTPAADAVADLESRWSTLESVPASGQIKRSQQRSVHQLSASPDRPSLVVKCQRISGFFHRLRALLLGSPGAIEAGTLRQLAARGVAVPEVLAVVEERQGPWIVASALVMERVTDSTLFSPWLEPFEGERRQRALEALGGFLRRLHRLGVTHGDLHGGNLLVREIASRSTFFLLDVARTRLGSSLTKRRRFLDQVALAHALGGPDHPDDVQAMARGYAGDSSAADVSPADLQKLVGIAGRRERRRRKGAIGRCWRTSSQFVAEFSGGLKINRRRNISPAAVEGALAEPSPVTVEVEHWLPRWPLPSVLARRLGPLHRAWQGERVLEVLRLQPSRLLALVERRRGGCVVEAWLVAVADGTDRDHARDRRWFSSDSMSDAASSTLPRWLRKLHDGGAMLYASGPGVFESRGRDVWGLGDTASVRWRGTIDTGKRLLDLAALASVWDGSVSPRDRVRFLNEYAASDPRFQLRAVHNDLDDALLQNFCCRLEVER